MEDVEEVTGRYGLALKRPADAARRRAARQWGDGPGALTAYERALHVARVNLGLFDPGPGRRPSTGRRWCTRRWATAWRRTPVHSYAFSVLLRAYGREDARLVPGLFTLAEWHQENHRVFSARRLFDRVVTIAASQLPPGDPRMIRGVARRGGYIPRRALSAQRERHAKPGGHVVVPRHQPQPGRRRQQLRTGRTARSSP